MLECFMYIIREEKLVMILFSYKFVCKNNFWIGKICLLM